MIQTYAFLAMFTLQIFLGSVLCPTWFIRRVQVRVAIFPAERFAELFPGVDKKVSGQRFVRRYRAFNTGVAVLGLLLLAWLSIHMQRLQWNQANVVGILTLYLIAQMSPVAFFGWRASRTLKTLKTKLADGKRKAVLQRRGLLDFVSPFVLFLAALSYIVFAALVLYLRQHPFPGFGGMTNIVIISLAWVFNGCIMYGCLYGKNRNPLVTYADRLHSIGVIVNTLIFTSIGVTVFATLQLLLSMLHLQRWGLVGVSVFFVIVTVVTSLGAFPRRPQLQDEIGAGNVSA